MTGMQGFNMNYMLGEDLLLLLVLLYKILVIWNGSFHSREEPEPFFICGWVINISTEKRKKKHW